MLRAVDTGPNHAASVLWRMDSREAWCLIRCERHRGWSCHGGESVGTDPVCIVADVGEDAFRRGAATMTGFDTESLSLDDVVAVYVLARQGRVGPPSAGRRAVAMFPSLPPPTVDDPCVDVSGRIGPRASAG